MKHIEKVYMVKFETIYVCFLDCPRCTVPSVSPRERVLKISNLKIMKNRSFSCTENPRLKTSHSFNVKRTQESRERGEKKTSTKVL